MEDFNGDGKTDWQIVAVTDFDGDLNSDLLWRSAATGQIPICGWWTERRSRHRATSPSAIWTGRTSRRN